MLRIYHCFDRMVINGYLSALTRPENAVYFFREVLGVGHPSIAPERLLRSLLLQIFYSVRSERMLIEQLQYNLLFRWFVGMEMDEAVWNHAVFSKNRERLLNEEIAESFFNGCWNVRSRYMSDEHFTVDGTLIEAWASQKSFRRKDGKGKPAGSREGRSTFTGRSGRTRRTNRRPIPMPGCSRSPKAARRSWATWDMS